MKDGVRIGMAVGLGYLLGRTRKMRLALMIAGVGVTGRLGKNPAALVKQGAGVLGSSPEFKTLTDTLRGRLVEVGKTAAITAVSSQVDTLSEKIGERTRSLGVPAVPGKAEEGDETESAGDGPEDEAPEDQAPDEEEPEERVARRRTRRTPARRSRRDDEGAEDAEDDTEDTEDTDEAEDGDEAESRDRAKERPRRPARPSARRPPVRRTRRREQ
jgi:hypothetical protein